MYVSCSREDMNCMLKYATLPLSIQDLLWLLNWERILLQLHLDCMICDRLATLSMKRWVTKFLFVLIASLKISQNPINGNNNCSTVANIYVALTLTWPYAKSLYVFSYSTNTSNRSLSIIRGPAGCRNSPQFNI